MSCTTKTNCPNSASLPNFFRNVFFYGVSIWKRISCRLLQYHSWPLDMYFEDVVLWLVLWAYGNWYWMKLWFNCVPSRPVIQPVPRLGYIKAKHSISKTYLGLCRIICVYFINIYFNFVFMVRGLISKCLLWHISTGWCGSVQSAKVRYGSRFRCQKWAWALLVSQYSSVGVLRLLKGCRALPASSSYAHHSLIGWQNHHRNHSTRKVILDNGVYWRKCCPSWTSYIVAFFSFFRSLCVFFFSLGFMSRLHCVGLLWGHDSCVAAAAIAIRLKPRPTIRVLSVMET